MDFTKPMTSTSGLRYHLLARACLCIESVVESPTVTSLQGMVCRPSNIQWRSAQLLLDPPLHLWAHVSRLDRE